VNTRLEKHSELEATVVVELSKADYQDKVDQQIKKIQKTARINGFRPGKAPLGMINKLYGKSVLADEIQQMASDRLNDYIKEEKLDILGYPIGSERIESQLDIENSDAFTFAFDIGLSPQFELAISEKDTLETFKIEVTNKEVDEDIEHARKQRSQMEDAETSDEESIVYAEVHELDENGTALEGGVSAKPISFVPSMIEDKNLKKSFVGIQKGAEIKCDVRSIFNNNEAVITNSLGIAKEGINDLSKDFNVVVTEIKTRILPELTPEYFAETFPGDDAPKTEEEYRARVKSNLEKYYENEASLWLDHEIGHLLLKNHTFNLPDEFLKRWLTATKQEDYTPENIEEKYGKEREALVRRLIIDKIALTHDLKADQEEIIQEAKLYYLGMYRQYGLNLDINDSFLTETVMKRFGEQEFISQMNDRVIYRKAYDTAKEKISLKEKKVNVEDYFKHVNTHKHQHGE
jgi:trigger factor